MTVNLSALAGAGWQFFDDSGVPLTGGLLYTYAAGTTTPLTTYTSNAGNVANSNPIVLDAAGRTPSEVWLTAGSSYKFVLKDSTNVQIGSYDNIAGINDFSYFSVPGGSALIGYLPGVSNAVATTVQAKLRQYVSVKDFGAVGDAVVDDTTAFTNAAAYSAVNLVAIYVPAGTYLVQNITVPSNASFYGDGGYVSVLKLKANTNRAIFEAGTSDHVEIDGLSFDCNFNDNPGPAPSGKSLSGIEIQSYAKITNCRFFGMQSAGVFGYGSYNLIENCIFDNFPYSVTTGTAVYITNATGASFNKMINNKVYGIGYGLCVRNTGTAGSGNMFIGNNIINLGAPNVSLAQSAAINAWRCSETLISNNVAYNCNGPAVRLIALSQNSVVTGNVARLCGQGNAATYDIGDSAEYLDKNLIISNNVCSGSGSAGFWFTSVYNSVISNNVSDSNGISSSCPAFAKAGFVVASEADSASTPVKDNTFSGNSCQYNDYAVSRTGSNAGVIVNNTHIGNQYINNYNTSLNYAPYTDNFIGNTGQGDAFLDYRFEKNYGAVDGAITSTIQNLDTAAVLKNGFDNNSAGSPGYVFQSTGSVGFACGSDSALSANRRLIVKLNGAVNFVPRYPAPSTPAEGDTYYDSGAHNLYLWNGTSWQPLA